MSIDPQDPASSRRLLVQTAPISHKPRRRGRLRSTPSPRLAAHSGWVTCLRGRPPPAGRAARVHASCQPWPHGPPKERAVGHAPGALRMLFWIYGQGVKYGGRQSTRSLLVVLTLLSPPHVRSNPTTSSTPLQPPAYCSARLVSHPPGHTHRSSSTQSFPFVQYQDTTTLASGSVLTSTTSVIW